MRGRPTLRRPRARLRLTWQVALLTLGPIVALGFALTQLLQAQVVTSALGGASESARLVARAGIQPRLTRRELAAGIGPVQVAELDQQLRAVARNLARVKVWNSRGVIVYSNDHALIGRSPAPSSGLIAALAGRSVAPEVVTPSQRGETASEVGLGRLVEVYVRLRFSPGERPAGAFEVYLSYRPIAAAIASDDREIVLVISIGLALLWAVLFPIVRRASRDLRRRARENYLLARHDQLTGLPNRTLFIDAVGDAIRAQRRHDGCVAVLLVDVEGFTEINDTLGHATGDEVLREVARRLGGGAGEDLLVARLGGDEYGVMDPRASGVAGARATAAAIQARLEAPISVDGIALNVEASVGVAVMGEHADDVDTLLQRADVALARARSRHGTVEVYSAEHDSSSAARLALLGEVRPALERDELILHYQAKIDLESRRIVGVEALLRWDHPERGLIPPLDFIPLVEQTALVGPVTLHVVDMALRQLASWRDLGASLRMAVNLSPRNLVDEELPAQIAALLERHRVPPSALIVEVTETATMLDPEAAVRALQTLRSRGTGVSIDDFGTGNASIAYLATLPASEIKVDRSLVTDICEDTRSEAIVRSIVDLARNLGLRVVAEGIETDAALARLADLGCELGQGFGIARPLPAPEMTSLLALGDGTLGGPQERAPAGPGGSPVLDVAVPGRAASEAAARERGKAAAARQKGAAARRNGTPPARHAAPGRTAARAES
jgi:diguanylate cyclase (GGDEF)-like protein